MASWIPAVRFFRFAARAPQKTPIVAAIGVFHFSAEALNLSKPPLRYGDDANDLYRRVFKKLRFLMRADRHDTGLARLPRDFEEFQSKAEEVVDLDE